MTMAEVVSQTIIMKDTALNGAIGIILQIWMGKKENIFPVVENQVLMEKS